MSTTDEKQKNLDRIAFNDFDKLNLKPFAENLLQNIEKGTSSSIGKKGAYTISLNAEFGNGKTTFLEMFKNFIEDEKNQNYNVISINAWESDFYKEPVIAILSEFVNHIKKAKQENKVKKMTETVGKIGVSISNQFVQSKTGINLKEIKSSLENGNNLLKAYNQRKESINDIKTTFLEYTKKKKLLIIIDELDRARPDHAVHFLEDMKHFFDIKNVIFLFAVNRNQIETTVKCLYGQSLDFNGYYRKFFKQEIDLPDIYKEVEKLIDDLIQKTNVKYYNRNEQDLIHRSKRIESICLSCRMFNLTLREIEYFIIIFEKILSSKEQIIKWIYMDSYSFFICLFLKERTAFNKILKGDFTVTEFCNFIKNKNFEYVLDEKGNESDITVANNIFLSNIACSFVKNKQEINEAKTIIEKTFKSGTERINTLLSHPDLFDIFTHQPAFDICEKINECKPFFNY